MSLDGRMDELEGRTSRLALALEKTISAVEASLSENAEKQINPQKDDRLGGLEARVGALEEKLERIREALSITIDTLERQVIR